MPLTPYSVNSIFQNSIEEYRIALCRCLYVLYRLNKCYPLRPSNNLPKQLQHMALNSLTRLQKYPSKFPEQLAE